MNMEIKKNFSELDFSRRLIKPDTWFIRGAVGSCDTYLLIGDERAAVIDPGMNHCSLREYIESITDLLLCVFNTHGHWDHTGNNGQFRDCPIYMSEYCAMECRICKEEKEDPRHCYTAYDSIVIDEGFMLDLGNRKLEAIACGCHNPGSLAYLDHKYRMLFPGDEIDSGQVLIYDRKDEGHASVERMLKNLKHIWERSDEFDMICPGYNGAPIDASIIPAFIENCERILSGIEGKKDVRSSSFLGPQETRSPEVVKAILENPYYRRSEWKGTSIVYDKRKILMKEETGEKK